MRLYYDYDCDAADGDDDDYINGDKIIIPMNLD